MMSPGTGLPVPGKLLQGKLTQGISVHFADVRMSNNIIVLGVINHIDYEALAGERWRSGLVLLSGSGV